ncbi:hypothetical protein SLEP1_g19664 [Rubroshorea leprosula]|uniref:Uncharacterized protein n=1 Tax=Rubroshorea leprosula TaxID=152421 RepID=A0AAV5J7Q4_9ROSI|nr:hypothetical protein SLEP1_g19664 [Rubroshorea leprosula]
MLSNMIYRHKVKLFFRGTDWCYPFPPSGAEEVYLRQPPSAAQMPLCELHSRPPSPVISCRVSTPAVRSLPSPLPPTSLPQNPNAFAVLWLT